MQYIYKLFFFFFSLLTESLDELTSMVVKLFGEVENKNVPIPEFPEHPFQEEHLRVSQLLILPAFLTPHRTLLQQYKIISQFFNEMQFINLFVICNYLTSNNNFFLSVLFSHSNSTKLCPLKTSGTCM